MRTQRTRDIGTIQLADRAGMPLSTLERKLNRRPGTLTLEDIERVAGVLDVAPTALAGV